LNLEGAATHLVPIRLGDQLISAAMATACPKNSDVPHRIGTIGSGWSCADHDDDATSLFRRQRLHWTCHMVDRRQRGTWP